MKYYLIHYGIPEMRWGVRNGPPYPLREGQFSAAEKRAGAKESKAIKYREKAEKYKKRSRDWIDRDYKIIAKRYEKKAEKIEKELDEKTGAIPEVLISIGSAVATNLIKEGVNIAADKLYRVKSTEQQIEELDSEKVYDSFDDLYENKDSDISHYLEDINSKNRSSTNNCVLCTTALVMREKGYDVNAAASEIGFFPKEYFSKTFKGSEYSSLHAKTPKDFINKLEKLGDGAYGHLGITWKYGGRHSVFFKNVDGNLKIYDGQSGKEIDFRNDSHFFSAIDLNDSHYIRLDKAEPNKKVLGALR